MITATVDNRDVMRKLNKLEQMTGKPLEKLVTQSVRRVCVNLAKNDCAFRVGASLPKSQVKPLLCLIIDGHSKGSRARVYERRL
jgi:hypothetical protein